MLIRIAIALAISLAITHSDEWLPSLYSYVADDQLRIIGDLDALEQPCNGGCTTQYKIPTSSIKDAQISTIGAGRFFGALRWFCETGTNHFLIHETGIINSKSRGGEMFQYQTANVPHFACNGDVFLKVISPSNNLLGKPGWKGGKAVIGPPSVVSAFKNISDFFSSYIRVMIGLFALLLVLFEALSKRSTLPIQWHRVAVILLSIHFVASSGVLDFLLPGFGFVGFPLLKAGGTSGFIAIILSLIASKELNTRSHLRVTTGLKPITIGGSLLILLLGFYYLYAGPVYANIQAVLAATTFALALVNRSPGTLLTATLLIADLLAVKGFLKGFPTNTSVHFFILTYIYDAFESMFRNSDYTAKTFDATQQSELLEIISNVCNRFGITRFSYSYFDRQGVFQLVSNFNYSSTGISRMALEEVPRISASVMTSRKPLLRVKTNSKTFKLLAQDNLPTRQHEGHEYSIFPLVYHDRVVGTLNFTGYRSSSLSDPKQLELLIELIERLAPRFAELLYKSDLSPNIEEEKRLLETSSKFLAENRKSMDMLHKSLDQIAEALDIRLIISEKTPNEDRFQTFTCHRYHSDDTLFLRNHTPRISETLVTSPASVSFLNNEPVFINHVDLMFPVYAEFLVSLLKRNKTHSLYVSPIVLDSNNDLPWGVVWVEIPYRATSSETEVRELAAETVKTIEQMLAAYFSSLHELKIRNQLGALIPARVLKKIESGQNPREEDYGFLLNIDLAGSTQLAKAVGDIRYSQIVSEVALELSRSLSSFNFEHQMTIWDAFIFTRSEKIGKLTDADTFEIERKLVQLFNEISNRNTFTSFGFRAVLHFGDITRDLTKSESKTWSIVGAALAESCKIEAANKDKKNSIILSNPAQERISSTEATSTYKRDAS